MERFMKKSWLVSILILVLAVSASSDSRYNEQKTRDRDRVNTQHASDMERKQKILEELDAFMKEINTGLGGDIPGKMVTPVLPDQVDDVEEIESNNFISPTRGTRTSDYGYRVHPITKKRASFHKGIDIAAP